MEIVGVIILIVVVIYALGFIATNKTNRDHQTIFKRGFYITLFLSILTAIVIGGFHYWMESRPDIRVTSLEVFNEFSGNSAGYTFQLEGNYENLRDKKCQIKICLFTNNGQPIPSNDGRLEEQGQTCLQEEITILLDNFSNNQTLFIPYEEIAIEADNDETPFFAIITIHSGKNKLFEQLKKLKFPAKNMFE